MKKRWWKKAVGLIMGVIIMSGAINFMPFATVNVQAGISFNIADSSFYLRTSNDQNQYSTDNLNWTDYNGNFTITGTYLNTTGTDHQVVVLSGVHNIVLNNCSFQTREISAFDIKSGAEVNLVLSGTNSLVIWNSNGGNYNGYEKAALHVPTGASLSISESTIVGGSLLTDNSAAALGGTGQGAGIGGDAYEGCGNIIIKSGTVTAKGVWGSSIGGGISSNNTGSINIYGGTVNVETSHGELAPMAKACFSASSIGIYGGSVLARYNTADWGSWCKVFVVAPEFYSNMTAVKSLTETDGTETSSYIESEWNTAYKYFKLEYSGSAVKVNNGTGENNYLENATVTITADAPSEGKRFKEWQVVSGGITLTNSLGSSTSFVMPDNLVEVTAIYEDIPAIYDITAGAGGTYNQGSSSLITVRCTGTLDKLTGIYVNNVLVDPSNYTLESGSTILKFKESYLASLSEGTYTLKFEYTDGSAETTFKISTLSGASPQTGDTFSLIWMFSALASGLTAATCLILKRKKSVI